MCFYFYFGVFTFDVLLFLLRYALTFGVLLPLECFYFYFGVLLLLIGVFTLDVLLLLIGRLLPLVC